MNRILINTRVFDLFLRTETVIISRSIKFMKRSLAKFQLREIGKLNWSAFSIFLISGSPVNIKDWVGRVSNLMGKIEINKLRGQHA